MMNIVYAILLVFCFCSCLNENKTEKVVKEFPVTEKLYSVVYKSSVPLFVPRYMGITGDYLYVYKEREKYKFVVYRIPEMEFLGEMGELGQGPNDFNLLDTRSFNQIEGGFQVVEASSHQLKSVLLDDGKMTVTSSKSISEQGYSGNGFYPLKDGGFLSLGRIEDKFEYSMYNADAENFTSIGEYPVWYDMSSQEIPFVVYLKNCVVNSSQDRIAAFYSRFKRFRIFDISMNLLYDVDIQVEPNEMSLGKPGELTPTYYINRPYAIGRYIYSLCSLSQTNKHGNSELHVWDWEGIPIACYELGRKISLFAIDEKRGRIYALNNEVEDEFYIYDLLVLD